jgi:diguanylate cyclase (GGDEF)-like protein/PAS domain S-box-containing protein
MEHYLHPSHRPAMREVTTVLALLVLGLLLAWALPLTDNAPAIAGYLPLHSLLETVSIVIAMMVFVVGWNDYQHKASVNLVPLASVFLGVACLDFSHIFAFPGMPDYATPNGPDKSIYFWLAARSMAALGMLAFVTFAWRQQSRVATRYTLLVAVLGMVGVLHWVFLFQVDSTQGLLLMPGVGLTPLKQYLEYSIIALNVAAAVILWRRMRTPQSFNAVLLFGAVCTMALSEVYFTLYAQATDVFNLLGHIYKLISYLFIYRVLVAATIEQPYRELSELQSAQQGMLDAIPDLLFEVDLSGRIDNYHSPRNDLLAAPPEVFIGKLFSEILPPEASQICLSALQEAAQNGWSTGKIYSLNLPQGECWFELSIAPIPQRKHHEQRFIVLSRDITERKQGEEAMRIAATAFESQQGMAITDAQQKILRVNKAFTEITGYSAQEAVGQTPRLLSSGRHDAAFYSVLWNHIATTGAWQGEIWNRRKNGEVYPEWLSITAVKDEAGLPTHYVAAFSDTSMHKLAEEQIQSLAFSDFLTGLPNRRHLVVRLQQALQTSEAQHRQGALLLVDLDDFKTLNDALGHDQGDILLQQVAKRLNSCVRECDTVARIGGDGFAVLLEQLNHNPDEAATQAEHVAGKILVTLNQAYPFGGAQHHSTASIGITLFDGAKPEGVDEYLRRAELAMYQAKVDDRNTLRFFEPQMQAVASKRVSLEAGLRDAILKNQFLLHYQAQVTDQRQIIGVEALVRWQHPERGMVSPAEFIPVAEETGLILPLGSWVMETACTQLAQWASQPAMAHLTIAVNVSARQFHQGDFVEQVLAVLARTGARADRLKLELTESLLVSSIESVIAKMNVLKEKGVGFSLDDFGTGYSSLSYLKRLPLDQLKIDQGFVRDILVDPNDAAIAKMVIALADSMGLAVIAEGVETEAQSEFLADLGCHVYQGYLFSRPLPIQAFEAFIAQR